MSWFFSWNDNTPRITSSSSTTAASSADQPSKEPVAPVRRRNRVQVRRLNPMVKKSSQISEEELAVAMAEKQVEEDERAAAAAMSMSNNNNSNNNNNSSSQPSEALVSGPGYMMIALQEQLMQLKAQIEAMQAASGSEQSDQVPPPVPERDDQNSDDNDAFVPPPPPPPLPPYSMSPATTTSSSTDDLPVAPPPPTPFKTPMNRRASVALKTIETNADASAANAPLSEVIREKTRSVLRDTGIPRSPGGTPARRSSEDIRSPGGILASALRNKFKSVRLPESPVKYVQEEENEDDEWIENKAH